MQSQLNEKYVRLPAAPRTGSPVPSLTSIHSTPGRGHYGDARYPGNCSGKIIRDILLYFQPNLVFDPMRGSGTCRDVCEELGIDCADDDIRSGFDACDASTFPQHVQFDFIWAHPPYWRMKRYTDDPRDLSNAPTVEEFLKRYQRFIRNCAGALAPRGRLAILMGDFFDRKAGFVPLTFHTKRLAFECGLKQDCTDIIRFQHNNSSSAKTYDSSFIPGLHDTCMIFRKRRRVR